ncbi:MAG: 1-acyl-sn-glycerol-3-phosphate acyltransferase [Clostridiales bacterium]|nr:1-acyl-sn-glycerol-3-phosphate acyltransferase [Clostridiales bacterium]
MPFLYRFGVALIKIWCALGGCRINGRENIPPTGAFLVIANHSSYADPILLAVAFPRHITFIAKEQFLRNGFTRWLYGTGLGAVFLNKEESDISALRTAIKLMKNGRTVGIFPEGRRNADQKISQFMPGAAFIALKAGVPVLPVAISNSRDLPRLWRRDVSVNIGRPIELETSGKATQEILAAQAALFQQKVTELHQKNVI